MVTSHTNLWADAYICWHTRSSLLDGKMAGYPLDKPGNLKHLLWGISLSQDHRAPHLRLPNPEPDCHMRHWGGFVPVRALQKNIKIDDWQMPGTVEKSTWAHKLQISKTSQHASNSSQSNKVERLDTCIPTKEHDLQETGQMPDDSLQSGRTHHHTGRYVQVNITFILICT